MADEHQRMKQALGGSINFLKYLQIQLTGDKVENELFKKAVEQNNLGQVAGQQMTKEQCEAVEKIAIEMSCDILYGTFEAEDNEKNVGGYAEKFKMAGLNEEIAEKFVEARKRVFHMERKVFQVRDEKKQNEEKVAAKKYEKNRLIRKNEFLLKALTAQNALGYEPNHQPKCFPHERTALSSQNNSQLHKQKLSIKTNYQNGYQMDAGIIVVIVIFGVFAATMIGIGICWLWIKRQRRSAKQKNKNYPFSEIK